MEINKLLEWFPALHVYILPIIIKTTHFQTAKVLAFSFQKVFVMVYPVFDVFNDDV